MEDRVCLSTSCSPRQSETMINLQENLGDGTLLFGWKSEPPLTPFAPEYIYYLTEKKIFSEEECKEWNTYLLKQEPVLLDKFRTSPQGDGGTGLGSTSVTSRYHNFNLLKFDFPLIEHLKTKIFDGICSLLDISGNSAWQETLYANCWFNVLREGEYMEIHSHGYSSSTFYGFHLTINATETFTSYFHPVKHPKGEIHTPNKIGYLTLFPNFIPHGVTANKYATPRVTIAGDIYGAKWLDNPDPYSNTKNMVRIGSCPQ